MPLLVLIWGQQCIKCVSIQQFAISQKMHADERPKLHLAATKLCGSPQIIIRQRNKWRAPDIFYSPR